MLAIDIDHVYMLFSLFNFVSLSHFFPGHLPHSEKLSSRRMLDCKKGKLAVSRGWNNSDNLKRDLLSASLEEDHACWHVYVRGN